MAQQQELRKHTDTLQNLRECPEHLPEPKAERVVFRKASKYSCNWHRCDQAAEEAERAEPPCLLPFSRPRVHAHHEEDDVKGRADVEDLEAKVPPLFEGVEAGPEEVDIAGYEDEGIEGLGDEGDTCYRISPGAESSKAWSMTDLQHFGSSGQTISV